MHRGEVAISTVARRTQRIADGLTAQAAQSCEWSLSKATSIASTPAGGLALLGSVLGLTVSSWFLVLPLGVGVGLLTSQDFRGQARFLQRAPWNRTTDLAC